MYQLKHYKESEFLPAGFTDISVMDERILKLADDIRELLDVPCTINADGRNWCGYRTPECTVGAPKSQHKLGKAIDLHPVGMSADAARKLILKAADSGLLPELGRMEADVNWVHCDLGPRKDGKVYLFHA